MPVHFGPGYRLYFTRRLKDDSTIAEYMTAILETDDTDLLLLALADVARAKGMAQVAKDAGLGRESLYKALSPGAKPRFDTFLKVARAGRTADCAACQTGSPPCGRANGPSGRLIIRDACFCRFG